MTTKTNWGGDHFGGIYSIFRLQEDKGKVSEGSTPFPLTYLYVEDKYLFQQIVYSTNYDLWDTNLLLCLKYIMCDKLSYKANFTRFVGLS